MKWRWRRTRQTGCKDGWRVTARVSGRAWFHSDPMHALACAMEENGD